jgi:hypothetical protein
MMQVSDEELSRRLVLLRRLEPLYGIPDSRAIDEFEIESQAQALFEGRNLNDVTPILTKGQTTLFRSVSISDIEGRLRKWRHASQVLRQQMLASVLADNFGRVHGRAWPLTEEIAMGRKALRESMEKAVRWGYPPPVADGLIKDLDRQVDCIFNHQDNERDYLLCLFEIESMHLAHKAPLDDLHTFGTIARQRHAVSRFLRSRGKNTLEREAEIFSQLNPYRMPGISLRTGMFRELQKDLGRNREAGDFPDAMMLTAAPYTDLTCVDKRTFAFIRQARTGKGRERLCPGVGENLVDARSLSAVEKAIAAAAMSSNSAGERVQ